MCRGGFEQTETCGRTNRMALQEVLTPARGGGGTRDFILQYQYIHIYILQKLLAPAEMS